MGLFNLYNSLDLLFDIVKFRKLNFEAEDEIELNKMQKYIEEIFEEFVKETKTKNCFLSYKI